jgi:hypothetical protein
MSPARQPTRIGNARPSQLMITAGVGAVVDLPGMSVVVRGLESWGNRGAPIPEPRLLEQVKRALPSAAIAELRAAPSEPGASDDPYTAIGVPVTTFPRWLRCPACHQLLTIDGTDQLQLEHRWGRRPDLAKWVHRHCPQQMTRATSKRRACIPARFVVACVRGHLDEFPYVDFVHERALKTPCPGAQLEMRDAGSVLGPRVTVTCTAGCGAQRNVSEAAGTRGAANLPRCRGRHPHLQTFEDCDEPLKLMVLGSSNLWFGVTVSALHLPEDDAVAAAIDQHWEVVSGQSSRQLLAQIVRIVPALHALVDLSEDDLWSAVEVERQRRLVAVAPEPQSNLLDAEWQLLSHPTTKKQDADFRALPTPSPSSFTTLLEQVVEVKRLREVQAMVGFTRIDAPGQGEFAAALRAPLSTGAARWVPAVERRGEGIFLELREPLVAAWCTRVQDHPHLDALRDSYRRWCNNREIQVNPNFPVARYLLIHTLSHLLLRQVALECGYSSASIRERLYVGTPAKPTAGLLLSTAASDSEGTLGGLVALAESRFLGRLLEEAINDSRTCSSDPLCGERVPEAPSDQLSIAACHACLYASETSCEAGNRWLHRGVLVDIADGLAINW